MSTSWRIGPGMLGVLVAAVLAALAGPAAAPPAVTVVKAARLFDARAGRIVTPGLVVVEGGRIKAVGGAAPAGAAVVDLGDATLLPHPHHRRAGARLAAGSDRRDGADRAGADVDRR
jgi:hypothetical protein